MLKILAKYVEAELMQAEEYCHKAMLLKKESVSVSETLYTLANEELNHAKKLLREGNKIISDKSVKTFETNVQIDDAYFEKCKIIWQWEHEMSMDKVRRIERELEAYRGV